MVVKRHSAWVTTGVAPTKISGTMVKMKTARLTHLAHVYLQFLITRDEAVLKGLLSTDFTRRLHVSQQLKLIKTLPTTFNYGMTPEIQLWLDYQEETDDGGVQHTSPFQFSVAYRNINNPLVSETTTVTIHDLVWENSECKIASILSEADHILLLHYAQKSTTTPSFGAVSARESQHLE